MTTTLKPASIGSISHGTLRPNDLLSAYLQELEWQANRNGDFLSLPENHPFRDQLDELAGEIRDCFDEDGEEIRPDMEETALGLMNETVPDFLSRFAPAYCYFGSHPGDGSDIGFWPCMDSISELPTIDAPDSDLARELGEDCAFINCHGNVTIYGADGSVILELV